MYENQEKDIRFNLNNVLNFPLFKKASIKIT